RNEFWKIPLDGGPPEEMLGGSAPIPGRFAWFRSGTAVVVAPQVTSSEFHLGVIDLATRVRRTITAGSTRDTLPDLSPDGGTLAFATGETGFDIVDVPLDGSAPRDVIVTPRGEAAPAWAPDGVRFAYVTDRSGGPEIWIRNRSDGTERLIAGANELPGI